MTAIPADVAALLAAIRDALNVPLPDLAPADEQAYQRLLPIRADRARIVAQSVLDGSDLPSATNHLRRWTTETPITYTPYTPAGKDTSSADQAPAGESTQPETAPIARYRDSRGTVWVHTGDHEADGSPLYTEDGLTPLARNNSPLYGLTVDEIEHSVGRLTPIASTHEACDLPQVSAPQPETAPDTCGRCRQPFDPADTRFDGHAQQGDTPWCRRCVDQCHESTDAFHRCAICTPDAEVAR